MTPETTISLTRSDDALSAAPAKYSTAPNLVRRKHSTLIRISVPLVALATLASFACPVAADALEPPLTTTLPKPSFFAYRRNDAEIGMTSSCSNPVATFRTRSRCRRRRGSVRTSAERHPELEDAQSDAISTKVLEDRSTPTHDTSTSPLPSPFDSLGPSAFKIPGGGDSCPKFMSSLLSDATFKDCHPISMLFETSAGFFNAQKQLVSTVKVLDATCAADVNKCGNFMRQAVQNLTMGTNCKSELENNQSQVIHAYRGLRAYNVLYSATCLRDPSQDAYCFANAGMSPMTVSDSYLYFMPYGLALPNASRPSCSWCTQNTMSIYHKAAADRDQLVASNYLAAARQIDTVCGSAFVNATLPSALNAALSLASPSLERLVANALFALLLLAWFL